MSEEEELLCAVDFTSGKILYYINPKTGEKQMVDQQTEVVNQLTHELHPGQQTSHVEVSSGEMSIPESQISDAKDSTTNLAVPKRLVYEENEIEKIALNQHVTQEERNIPASGSCDTSGVHPASVFPSVSTANQMNLSNHTHSSSTCSAGNSTDCTECKRNFTESLNRLNQEFLAKTLSSQSIKIFTCDQCGINFLERRVLNKHRLTHRLLAEEQALGRRASKKGRSSRRHLVKEVKNVTSKTAVQNVLIGNHEAKQKLEKVSQTLPVMDDDKKHITKSGSCDFSDSSSTMLPTFVKPVVHVDTSDVNQMALSTHSHCGSACSSGKSTTDCTECKRSFTESLNRLNEELLNKTLSSQSFKIYTCDQCRKNFVERRNLNRHRIHCSGFSPYQCSSCDKQFVTKRALNIHFRVHNGERPFQCEHCSKTFVREYALHEHMQSHASEFRCPQCSMTFPRRSRLAVHIRTHIDKRFQCDTCGKSFLHTRSLARHQLLHTGQRPFKCPQCRRSFGRQDHLSDHMRTHTGEKPYQCRHCSKTFSQSGVLNRHIKAAHLDDGEGGQVEDGQAVGLTFIV